MIFIFQHVTSETGMCTLYEIWSYGPKSAIYILNDFSEVLMKMAAEKYLNTIYATDENI